MISASSTPEIP